MYSYSKHAIHIIRMIRSLTCNRATVNLEPPIAKTAAEPSNDANDASDANVSSVADESFDSQDSNDLDNYKYER